MSGQVGRKDCPPERTVSTFAVAHARVGCDWWSSVAMMRGWKGKWQLDASDEKTKQDGELRVMGIGDQGPLPLEINSIVRLT